MTNISANLSSGNIAEIPTKIPLIDVQAEICVYTIDMADLSPIFKTLVVPLKAQASIAEDIVTVGIENGSEDKMRRIAASFFVSEQYGPSRISSGTVISKAHELIKSRYPFHRISSVYLKIGSEKLRIDDIDRKPSAFNEYSSGIATAGD